MTTKQGNKEKMTIKALTSHKVAGVQADACTSQAYSCMYCMHCPMMSQADACSYCMGSVVLILSRMYLYLQVLCMSHNVLNICLIF